MKENECRFSDCVSSMLRLGSGLSEFEALARSVVGVAEMFITNSVHRSDDFLDWENRVLLLHFDFRNHFTGKTLLIISPQHCKKTLLAILICADDAADFVALSAKRD